MSDPIADCSFKEGHSPICESKEGKLAREISELLNAIYAGEFGTKNRGRLIIWLQKIKTSF